MSPQLLTISRDPGYSFTMQRYLLPNKKDHWHFHAEVELIHFKKGQGVQFVGDDTRRFKEGDIVLVGANLPHYWRFDELYFEKERAATTDIRVLHFGEDCWGDSFLHLPENAPLKNLLFKAKRGLQVEGAAREKVAALLGRLLEAEGMSRLLLLMETLYVLAGAGPLPPLASIGFRHETPDRGHGRFDLIYDYSIQNFQRPIQLEEIAAVAGISPNSFCRFFKSQTRKTYSRFLIEVRVGHACKLLIENNLSIKQLCYESGFNNFTSFYKYFKLITGKSPLSYQREFMA